MNPRISTIVSQTASMTAASSGVEPIRPVLVATYRWIALLCHTFTPPASRMGTCPTGSAPDALSASNSGRSILPSAKENGSRLSSKAVPDAAKRRRVTSARPRPSKYAADGSGVER